MKDIVMTRQEAIAMIEDDKKRHHDELSGRYRAALTMAIEALQQQTAKCDNCKYSEETDGMNCYECLKGMSDNFEALECEQNKKQERTRGIPMEDWLRGCVYHDGRNGEVTLPTDKVIEIANYIQATRTGITDGMIYLPPYKKGKEK